MSYVNVLLQTYLEINARAQYLPFKEIAAIACISTLAILAGVGRIWVEIGSKAECDTSAGELYRDTSPGKVSSLDKCKQTCETSKGCLSITFYNGGWCSHYSTPCSQVKWNGKATALKIALTSIVTTTSSGSTTKAIGKFQQQVLSSRVVVIDLRTGVKPCLYIHACHVSSLLEIHAVGPICLSRRTHQCLCSVLFSATCVSILAIFADVKRKWVDLGPKTECDTNAGEVFLKSSPGKVSNLEQCKKLCQDTAACQSVTYFKSGWCSHYSTSCAKTKKNTRATYTLRLIADAAISTALPSPPTTKPGRFGCLLLVCGD